MRLWLFTLIFAAVASAAPKVTFTKEFKGATPPLFSIVVNRDGTGVYREGPDDDPQNFKLTDGVTEKLFDSLAKVDNGKTPLESGLRVANLGKKTITFEDGAVKNEVSFNYSTLPEGQAVAELFERIAETQQFAYALDSSMHFDKLGVNKLLLQIETAWDRKRILGEERLIPMLDKIAANSSYMNIARERAAKLAAIFRDPTPKTEQAKTH